MSGHQDIRADGTVAFLPHRLNRHPIIVRGLTADELWVCAGISGAAGLIVGTPLSFAFASIAVAPTAIVAAIAVGVYAGGGVLRRQKRGRPDVWLYRQIQWWIARRLPALIPFAGGADLITHSGYWITRRTG